MIPQSWLANAQWEPIPCRTVRTHIAACVKAHSAWPTNRGLHIGLVEPHSLQGKPIQIWCLDVIGTIAAEVIPAQLVSHNEQNVLSRFAHFRSLSNLDGIKCLKGSIDEQDISVQ